MADPSRNHGAQRRTRGQDGLKQGSRGASQAEHLHRSSGSGRSTTKRAKAVTWFQSRRRGETCVVIDRFVSANGGPPVASRGRPGAEGQAPAKCRNVVLTAGMKQRLPRQSGADHTGPAATRHGFSLRSGTSPQTPAIHQGSSV